MTKTGCGQLDLGGCVLNDLCAAGEYGHDDRASQFRGPDQTLNIFMMEYFFQSHEVWVVFINQGSYVIADLEYPAICITLFGPDRTAGDFTVLIDDTVTSSSDPRIDTDKLQPVSEDIFSITSSETSKLA